VASASVEKRSRGKAFIQRREYYELPLKTVPSTESTAPLARPVLAQLSYYPAIVPKRDAARAGEQRGEGELQSAQRRGRWRWLRSGRINGRGGLLHGGGPVSINFWMRHAEKANCSFLNFTHGAHPVPLPIQFHGLQISAAALAEQMQWLKVG
jgi:hypothetical protein